MYEYTGKGEIERNGDKINGKIKISGAKYFDSLEFPFIFDIKDLEALETSQQVKEITLIRTIKDLKV